MDFLDSKRQFTRAAKESIIEVAAVKIKKGEIVEHYSSFVAIENYDPHDFELGLMNHNSKSITNLHLIGAPRFKSVCERLHEFSKDCDLVVRALTNFRDPFTRFKESAMNCGYLFNQPVWDIRDFLFASELRERIGDKTINMGEMTLPEIATEFKTNKSWAEIFDEYGIYLFDKETLEIRGGSLSWALAFAQLLIEIIIKEEEWEEENLKKEAHEGLKKWRKDRANNENSTQNSNLNSIDEKPPF